VNKKRLQHSLMDLDAQGVIIDCAAWRAIRALICLQKAENALQMGKIPALFPAFEALLHSCRIPQKIKAR
jgi:hypothetical protein